MAKNISLMGASYADVPAIVLPQTGGGTARFDDASVTTATASDVAQGKIFLSADGTITTGSSSGGNATWMGSNPTLIHTELDSVYLKDTDYSDWTPSTSSTVIKSPETAFTFQADTENKEYLVHTQFAIYLSYESEAQQRGMFLNGNGEYWHGIVRHASNPASLKSETRNTNAIALVVNSQSVYHYYAANGVESCLFSMAYGIYPTIQNPVLNSTTSFNPIVTISTPQISARCNDSYFSPANATLVDVNASYYKVKYEVWAVDEGTSLLRNIKDARMYVFNHGLS